MSAIVRDRTYPVRDRTLTAVAFIFMTTTVPEKHDRVTAVIPATAQTSDTYAIATLSGAKHPVTKNMESTNIFDILYDVCVYV